MQLFVNSSNLFTKLCFSVKYSRVICRGNYVITSPSLCNVRGVVVFIVVHPYPRLISSIFGKSTIKKVSSLFIPGKEKLLLETGEDETRGGKEMHKNEAKKTDLSVFIF